ncbi:MAG: TonB-dependent receptor [Acidobacteria bacterium]|nr:TonB-dependent receptor [Acidobacteriota bacterium]
MCRLGHAVMVLLASLPAAAQSSAITVKVVDPGSAPVAGARIELLRGTTVIAVTRSAAEGTADFDRGGAGPGQLTVAVLAPGFAPVQQPLGAGDDHVTIRLTLATIAQSVVVTADATPVSEDAGGLRTGSLDGKQLETLNPVAASDALRMMPGAIVNTAGQRGGLASLFVRGGESRYNKVIEDGVPVDDPGGTFDFGVVPLAETDRIELVRGADSALYGSDAMTSVVQIFSRAGSAVVPEFRLGADGGTFATASGYASLAGARGRYDFNLFADQFNTLGKGPNDAYGNSLQGANVGVVVSRRVNFRLRTRHSNSRAGNPGEWNFEGRPLLPPDQDARSRQNNFLAGAELDVAAPGRWQHRITLYEYNHRRLDEDLVQEPGRATPAFGNFDFPYASFARINRAGGSEQSEYSPRAWSRSILGTDFEDENGFVGDTVAQVSTHGLRRNFAFYGEQIFNWQRLTLVAGGRFVHNESFGNRGVPRASFAWQLLRGGQVFAGTRLRFSYAEGIKEPRFEESFGQGGFGILPNPHLRPEANRGLDAGLEQIFLSGRYALAATWFNNQFRDVIDFNFNSTTFLGQYVNVNRAFAQGAEVEVHGRPARLHNRLRIDAAYVYTSGQILVAPLASDPLLSPGAPLLRRPRHAGNVLAGYSASRWGGSLGGSFIGSRPDSDFLGLVPPITRAPAYQLINAGAWLALNRRLTAYANLENLLNRRYEEVVGYPGLPVNIRAGIRFRIGGE